MTDRSAADDLEYHVRAALKIADDLKLWVAAAALDQALIALTGTGVMPPGDECQPASGDSFDTTDAPEQNGVGPNRRWLV
jgi:hypothetical protein